MALNDAKVKAAKPRDKAYKLTDSGQLFLHVTTAGGKHWRMNYSFAGRQRTLTIGPYPIVSLGDAREARDTAKRQLLDGRDPGLEKKLARGVRAEQYDASFEAIARRWFETNKARWSQHHAADVIRSLERDIFPSIGSMPITDLREPRILAVLTEIQDRGSIETGQRVQQRMAAVFGYAMAAGMANSNPAAVVRDALKKVVRRGRRPAITDLDGVRQVLADLEAARAQIVTKLAHRFLALTSARPGEVRGAAWAELEDVDLTGEIYGPRRPLWRIPAARMKGDLKRKDELGGDHLVPLSLQAVDVLVTLHRLTGRGPLLFPNHWRVEVPMSENAMGFLLNSVGYKDRHVPHGWRAAMSTIMNERAERLKIHGDRAIIDLMLAHIPTGKVEGAYNRAAFMERRRELAQQWADMLMVDAGPAEQLLDG